MSSLPPPSPSDQEAITAYVNGSLLALPSGWVALQDSNGNPVIQSTPSDGFYAGAFINISTNQIIIGFKATDSHFTSTYSWFSIWDDLNIYFVQPPQANQDAINFTNKVIKLGNSPSNIFVDGYSLGGEEAEAVAANVTGLGGGSTYGAPGLPGYSGGVPTSLIDYENYGDPIGNYSWVNLNKRH